MYKSCNKCKHTMVYDPYFKSYVCRQCGNYEMVKENISTNHDKLNDKNVSQFISAKKIVSVK
jgi:DNA-directed RNA polymerase subunit M/transcription elongation factor TFIIS